MLDSFILMLRLVDHTLCLDQLYSCTVIMLSSLCTPVWHFVDTTYTHLWCTHCAWISCTAVHLYFSPVSVHSWTVYTTALYNCKLVSAGFASVLSTNHKELRFTCFALIGPLGVPANHLISPEIAAVGRFPESEISRKVQFQAQLIKRYYHHVRFHYN